jgi:hypothetical protein
MRVRLLLLLSIVLNVALAAAFLGWFSVRPKNLAASSRPVVIPSPGTNVVRIIKTNVLVRPRTFTWQEVETPDYVAYVDNLRGLGMPETTVRDIIIADVDQIFARRRHEEAATQDIEWWRSEPSDAYQSNALARASGLEMDRDALLTRLLGENWKQGREVPATEAIPLAGEILGALPEDVKKSVRDIAALAGRRVADYIGQMDVLGRPASELELARLREQTREELAKVLNAQQLEEFLLRYSNNANRLRSQFAGLSLSPDEFRALFRATDRIDRDIELKFAGNDSDAQRQRAALEMDRASAIEKILGAERFESFVMMGDPDYKEALSLAGRIGANKETATALYEITRATKDEVDRVSGDTSLSAAEKQQQLREIELEQQRARAMLLGEQPTVEPPPQPPVPQMRVHAKEPGETLGQMAFRFRVTIRDIREANPGLDINRLPAGVSVNIPYPAQPPLPVPAR